MHPADATAFTLRGALERSLGKYRDRPAVRFEGDALTYGELDGRANGLANALDERGVGVGDGVAMLLENSLEFVVARVAIAKLGAVFVPVNPGLTAEERSELLGDVALSAVVCDPGTAEGTATLDVEHRLLVGGDREGFERFADVERTGATDAPPSVEVSPEDPAGYHFTGGTTGTPKVVRISQRARTTNLYGHHAAFDLTGEDRLLVTTPLTHAARLFTKATLLVGGEVVLRRSFDAGDWLEAVERHDVTASFVVPTMIYRVLDHPSLDARSTDSLRTIAYGAAPITPTRLREGIDAFGPVFVQFYGQVEVPNLVTTFGKREHAHALAEAEERLQSAGTPALMADVRTGDLDTGEALPRGEVGELVATAPYVMDEYVGAPEETARTLRDGWVRTGDVGRIDEDGYVYLLDRRADVIVTGGMNVYSTNVEDALADHPAVDDCAVVGLPDEKWGEAVTAFVVGDEATAENLRAFAADRLADYERPKRVVFLESLPETAYGKVDKAALRADHWDGEGRSIH